MKEQMKQHGLWRGGKPKCIDCNIVELAYSNRGKRCRKCWNIFAVGINSSNWKGGKLRLCIDCSKNMNTYSNRQQRCFSCAHKRIGKLLSGHNNPSWKGGITNIIAQIRQHDKYKYWRKAIYSRDNYTCVICGDNRGGNLEADHIIRLCDLIRMYNIKTVEDAISKEALWDSRIGRTLCSPCHLRTKTYGNRGKNIINDMGVQPYMGIGDDITRLIKSLFNNNFEKKINDIDALLVLYQDNVYPFFETNNGKIISMLLLYVVKTFSRYLGCIEEVVTLEEYRNQGISSGLIQKAIYKATMLGLNCIELTCKPEYVDFYKKVGFEIRNNKTMRKWINNG